MTGSRWPGSLRLLCLFLVSFATAFVQGCLLPRAPRRAPDLRARTTPPPSPVPDPDRPAPGDGTAALDLKSLQEFARRRNPSVTEWRARVEAAQARTRQIRSLYFPQLRSTGRYLRLDDEVAFALPDLGRIVVQDRDVYTQTTVIGYDEPSSHHCGSFSASSTPVRYGLSASTTSMRTTSSPVERPL